MKMGLFGPPNVEKMEAKNNVNGLIKALGYCKDAGVRRRAARALGQLGDPSAVEPLINALKDKSSRVRVSATEALVKIGDPHAVEPLIATLKDENERVRREAVIVLGQLGDSRAVEPLIAALKDEEHSVRSTAAGALGEIGDPRAVEPLINTLKDEENSLVGMKNSVRRSAANALVKIYHQRTLDEKLKKNILTVHHIITCPHTDGTIGECSREHTDIGIGVDFPL